MAQNFPYQLQGSYNPVYYSNAQGDINCRKLTATGLITGTLTNAGIPLGIATLDVNGKLMQSQVPTDVLTTASVGTASGLATLTTGSVLTSSQIPPNVLLSASQGAASGLATLDATTHLTLSQLPTSALTTASKGVPNGLATLNSVGALLPAQIPLNVVLEATLGVPNGVATLNSGGTLTATQLAPATPQVAGAVFGYTNASGDNNLSLGFGANGLVAAGQFCTAAGVAASSSQLAGAFHNTSFGTGALSGNTNGPFNAAFGSGAGATINGGESNSCFGDQADVDSATASHRSVFGAGVISTVDDSITFDPFATTMITAGLGSNADGTGAILSLDSSGNIRKTGGTHTTVASIDAAFASLPIFASGNWTPVITVPTNLGTISNPQGTFIRVGNIVYATISVTGTLTTATSNQLSSLSFTLPVVPANNFTIASQLFGTLTVTPSTLTNTIANVLVQSVPNQKLGTLSFLGTLAAGNVMTLQSSFSYNITN